MRVHEGNRAAGRSGHAYRDVTRDVDAAPPGPGSIAFFDFDGTLIFGYSIAAVFRERVLSGRLGVREALTQFFSLIGHGVSHSDYSVLLEEAARSLSGLPEQEFVDLGERVFLKHVAGSVYPESRALLRAHQARGHTVAILSSATRYQVGPFAREFGIEHVLCNHFEVGDGLFTGEILEPVVYARGKLEAASRFAAERGVELADCWFYTDGLEDLPLLEAVGRPRPTNPDPALTEVAQRRDWPLRRFSSRGLPGFREVVRTGLVYGAFLSAALSIVPTWILNRSRRDAVNLAVTTWGEFGSALAGIDVRVRGEHYLWVERPAVFLFNHQSAIDVLIIAKLLRRDFNAIAKQEIALNPLVGPVFRVADTVFVDRSNNEKAIQALKPVVRSLRSGLSLAIAPEGTRSVSDRLGPFKKGPFHIAMQAGVPVVPIVIHNAADVLPKGGFFVRPTTVEVDVLPPVDTGDWRAGTVDEHVAEIRGLYLDVLRQREDAPPLLKRIK